MLKSNNTIYKCWLIHFPLISLIIQYGCSLVSSIIRTQNGICNGEHEPNTKKEGSAGAKMKRKPKKAYQFGKRLMYARLYGWMVDIRF